MRRIRINRDKRTADAVNRTPITGHSANLEQAAGDKAHSIKIDTDVVIDGTAILRITFDPAVGNSLEILVVINVKGESLLGPLGPFAAEITQQVGTFSKITGVIR